MTHADFNLSFGDFYHPSPGFGYARIGTISPALIVQFLDNGVDLRLKSFKPPVRCLASFRSVRGQPFQLRPQPPLLYLSRQNLSRHGVMLL
jgi:hypothetical protein